jgi:hypothetical protein
MSVDYLPGIDLASTSDRRDTGRRLREQAQDKTSDRIRNGNDPD